MANPLVASAVDTTSPFSGAYLIEDGQALVDAVASGDWIEGGMAAFSAALDTAAMIVDPIGTLIANGLGWVLDHVEPLKGWLNDVTGDAGEVAAFAQTWRNIAGQLHDGSETFARRTHDLDGMSGATLDAYLAFAGDTIAHLRSTGDWATAIAGGLEVASQLVHVVHDLVRDAISQIVGTAISVAAEVALTVGFATPAAIGQITTKVASLATRVGKTITRLLSSLGKLKGLLGSLEKLFAKGSALVTKMLHGGSGKRSVPSVVPRSAPGERVRHTGASIDRAPRGLAESEAWGDAQYERIRQSRTDVRSMLQHPEQLTLKDGHQLTEHELNAIKQHLFEDQHLLKDYVTGEMYYARFDSDARQAAAWGRFELGTATDLDRLMLQHELAELRYLERNPGAPYREAHDAANIIADWNAAWRATHTRG